SSVICLFKSFQTDSWNKVLHPGHLPAEFFVDQCAIGKAQELAVCMFFTESNNVFLSHQRLAAGKYVHICAQFFSLGNDRIKFFKGKIQTVAVLCCPASGAVHVACRGRIQKYCPRNIASFFFHLPFTGISESRSGSFPGKK